ncbi:uncharacterized protein LOC135388539 isoform X2 [Ornithodoros turicata]|uniref:uncharacterized protein LOC135388539 isoform X2 n=1 Tax=Ornithodoros turicata TaxID=34597 RepID=UPI003139A162
MSRKGYKRHFWDSAESVPRSTSYAYKRKLQDQATKPVGSSGHVLANVPAEEGPAATAGPSRMTYETFASPETVEVTGQVDMPTCAESTEYASADEAEDDCSPVRESESESDTDESEDDDSDLRVQQPDELDEPLYQGCRLSLAESLLLVMGFILRHKVTKEAAQSLAMIVQAHLPAGTSYPATKYLFKKYFDTCAKPPDHHFYCYCGAYLTDKSGNCVCSECSRSLDTKELLNKGQYFLSFDLESQLTEMLKKFEASLLKPSPSINMTDIHQSPAYNSLPVGKNDVSLTFNTDGVQLFESSQFSIWPITVQVNELPFKERLLHPAVAGLWFGKTKPNFKAFFHPFVKTMNRLSTQGFKWSNAEGEVTTKVFPGPCTVDSVARAPLVNMHQFNGRFGCLWCFHEGEVIAKGRGHTRVYPITDREHAIRTSASVYKDATKARQRNEPTRGILGPSVLFLLSYFDICKGVVVDYMHTVCLGVVKATTVMWLTNASQPYYLKPKLGEVNQRILNIKTVAEISRLPRKVTDYNIWKASEWRAWLLFYSVPVLTDLLPKKYLKNWKKLVMIMHKLLSFNVNLEELDSIQAEVLSFARRYQALYGTASMTYNMHLVTHLVLCVKNWGPLWAYSNFPFEHFNGVLTRMCHGTRHIESQIAYGLSIWNGLPALCRDRSVFRVCTEARKLWQSFIVGSSLQIVSCSNEHIRFTGKGRVGQASHTAAVLQFLQRPPKVTKCFTKLMLRGVRFDSKTSGSRRCNSLILTKDMEVVTLKAIYAYCFNCSQIPCSCNNVVLVVSQWSSCSILQGVLLKLDVVGNLKVIHCSDILCKCITININESLHACPVTVRIECW